METSKLVTALTGFSQDKKIDTFGGAKTAISHDTTWKKLKRIWNDGHGSISFAQVDPKDKVLLINKLFCSKKEVKDINENLKVPFKFVELGYPNYYFKGLLEMRD